MPAYPILLTLQQAAKRSGKSEKTLRRWIKDKKLTTYHGDERKPGDPYIAATGGDKTKEWQIEQEIADLRMRVVMLESMVCCWVGWYGSRRCCNTSCSTWCHCCSILVAEPE